MCIAYCFSAATMVARTRLNVTVIRTLPVLSLPEVGRRANFRNAVIVTGWCDAQSDQYVLLPLEAPDARCSDTSPYILIYPFPPELFNSLIAEHQKCYCERVVKMRFRNYAIQTISKEYITTIKLNILQFFHPDMDLISKGLL
jgi:hypothetical protein